MDIVCRHSRSPEYRITCREYANVMALFVENYHEMQIVLNNILTTAARIGIDVNKVFLFYIQKQIK